MSFRERSFREILASHDGAASASSGNTRSPWITVLVDGDGSYGYLVFTRRSDDRHMSLRIGIVSHGIDSLIHGFAPDFSCIADFYLAILDPEINR
jgi:hypothetical protein